MEFAQIIMWLGEKTPEFVIGFIIGMLAAVFICYLYLLPRFVKNATIDLKKQVDLLTRQSEMLAMQVSSQTEHIQKLENELAPYRKFAEHYMNKLLSSAAENNINTDYPG